MATVLVTGGSGFVGAHLIRELRERGHRVRALSRREDADATLRALGAEPVRGDLVDAASLRNALDAATDAVFHAAADTNTWRPDNARQTAINVAGTRALVGAALERGVGAFIHTSSVSSFSHLAHGPLVEDTPRLGGDSWINYERTKFLAEQAVREAMARGLNAVIVYPSHILGPGDTRNWARLIQLIDQRKLPGAPPGGGPFADVREIARAEVRAWERRRYGEAYLLGGEQTAFLDLIQRIGRLLGRRTPRRTTPAFALRAYARVVYWGSLATRKAPPITPEAAALTCHELRVDCSKAQRELDYRITPLDTLLADTIAWLRDAGLVSRA